MGFSIVDNNLDKVITNNKKNSTVKVKLYSRSLTNGEIQLAQSVFKDTIEYLQVRIFKGSYFPFDLQNEDTFVTPNGSIFIMEKHFKTDYSLAGDDYKKIFLHELGHVWQHNRKFSVLARAGGVQACGAMTLNYYDPYVYNIWEKATVAQYVKHKMTSKRFLDYNLESQAEIFADYWLLINNKDLALMKPENKQNNIDGHSRRDVLNIYRAKISQVIG